MARGRQPTKKEPFGSLVHFADFLAGNSVFPTVDFCLTVVVKFFVVVVVVDVEHFDYLFLSFDVFIIA